MGRMTSFLAIALLATGFCAEMNSTAVAAGHTNPVDRVSNPGAVDFDDVDVSLRNLSPSFLRDGVVIDRSIFTTIVPGLTQANVVATLGAPLRRQNSRGTAWSYNFKFQMPQSQNYLVCQYEVLFNKQQLVSDTVWRRRQCQQLADSPQTVM